VDIRWEGGEKRGRGRREGGDVIGKEEKMDSESYKKTGSSNQMGLEV